MASRTAKFASSIVAGILAGVPLTAPRNVAQAADCQTEPGKDGTRGQHWYYRIEHGSKRHCWYLRDGTGKAAQTAPADDSVQASKPAAQAGSTPPRSLEDARAEYPMPQSGGNAAAAPEPATAATAAPVGSAFSNPPQTDAPGSAIASRWPSPDSASAPPAIAPAAPQAAAVAAADTTASAATTDQAADEPADTAPAGASAATAAKPSVSLQMLFAVIGGALALAGLTASIIFRFGRRRQIRLATSERRAVLWDGVESGPTPPWLDPTEPAVPVKAPLLAPERKPPPTVKTQERYDKIEEILAQLVKQAQQSDA